MELRNRKEWLNPHPVRRYRPTERGSRDPRRLRYLNSRSQLLATSTDNASLAAKPARSPKLDCGRPPKQLIRPANQSIGWEAERQFQYSD